jgi:hypothetical protein
MCVCVCVCVCDGCFSIFPIDHFIFSDNNDTNVREWQWNRSLDWENPDGIKCAKETAPILDVSMKFNLGTDRRLFAVAANITGSMKVPVHFINITKLSEYRKDAHTSVYTIRQGKMLTPEQQADPATYADCIHWCLPGLPDTWNEFLYTRIISRTWPLGIGINTCEAFFFVFFSHPPRHCFVFPL